MHLASSSARRVEILETLGVSFSSAGVDIDETPGAGEPAPDLVMRLAIGKARAAAATVSGWVLGSDTVVVLDGRIFGKPGTEQVALDMLAALSGRRHTVLTAVALIRDQQIMSDLSETAVQFREVSRAEASRYWQSGEAEGKAGAYAIQGVGGVFVESIEGSYTGVMGLPVYETAKLLEQAGITLLPGTVQEA